MTQTPVANPGTAPSPPVAVSYLGPREVLLNQAITLQGKYDPLRVTTLTLIAEDRFPLGLQVNPQTASWQVQLPQGFKTPGVRWLRLKGTDASGKTVGEQVIYITVSTDPMTIGQDFTLKILENSLFKACPIDSSKLPADQKAIVSAGQTFRVIKYGFVDGHLKLVLDPPIAPLGEFGYFYEPHVQLSKGSRVLRFTISDVPDNPLGGGQALITQTTLLKAKPEDSSKLPDSQKTQLVQGLSLPITGYAAVPGHFRLSLVDEIPAFGKTGFVYWQHVQIKRDGKVVSFSPNALTVWILKTTVFKKRPVASASLKSNERAVLQAGSFYGVSGYVVAEDHIKVALTENIPGFGNTGYIFTDHVQLKRGGQPFNPAPKQIELNVPYFSQRDNPRLSWATCNVTSIAMVLAYYGIRSRGGGQLEDEMLQWCLNKYGEGSQTDNAVLSALIKAYGFKTSFTTTRRWVEVKTELMNGRPVVLGGYFTHGGHIITLVGYNAQGFIVNDPWGDALSGYTNTEGRKLLYPYNYMDRVAGPDRGVWAHFIEKQAARG
ncbi:MAG: C39 family peptidase [Leptolyngbyaceae cyanobacterium bins.59]|nr:C39 family peptidase [Leptolyngbyaceae cyanobacterium bins.59]